MAGAGVRSLHTDEYAKIIKALVMARKSAKVSQVQIAGALGLPQSFVSKIESCQRRLDILEFCLYAQVIGRSPAPLLDEVLKSTSKTLENPES